MSPQQHAAQAVEAVAREHYGRLLAHLAVAWRDPAAAEDALATAFATALAQWPAAGVPEHPQAWLLAVARNALRQQLRHRRIADGHQPALVRHVEDLLDAANAPPEPVADERLRLMFVCAHPAIDPRVRCALMLQLVLGVEVQRMAAAFLLAPATLAQRLVRAKHKIAGAGIGFALPEAGELPARLHDVLEAIYAAYARGRPVTGEVAPADDALGDEALRLATLVVECLPREPEALGLLALLRYCEARRAARFDAAGRFVPLAEHDTTRWDIAAIEQAEALLRAASSHGKPGPFQLEAAIQSAHCTRRHGGATPWPMIAACYDALLRHWPSVGAAVGAAVAVVECGRAADALDRLDALDGADVADYAPYWAARAHALGRLGDDHAARGAWQRAAGLTAPGAAREFLLMRAG